jgi:DNA/RNA-binding domain of Phe-tRNA-synthetase-like protein
MNTEYALSFDGDLVGVTVCGMIWAEDVVVSSSEEMPGFLVERVHAAQAAGEDAVPAAVRDRVRRMLRHGKYKPSGRGKPASEFLLRAALGGEFPWVNGPVDVNNAISLESGFPGSIFDAGVTGRRLLIRRGRPGETYVFNPSGQSIDLEDLLLVCRPADDDWVPCGNPVKDSVSTKIGPHTTGVVAVLYAPADEPDDRLAEWCIRFAELLSVHCGAERTGWQIFRPQ